ncbi:hypothetical protein [Streptosporangium canum]
MSWSVKWDSEVAIPYRNHSWKGNPVTSSAVDVTTAVIDRNR